MDSSAAVLKALRYARRRVLSGGRHMWHVTAAIALCRVAAWQAAFGVEAEWWGTSSAACSLWRPQEPSRDRRKQEQPLQPSRCRHTILAISDWIMKSLRECLLSLFWVKTPTVCRKLVEHSKAVKQEISGWELETFGLGCHSGMGVRSLELLLN